MEDNQAMKITFLTAEEAQEYFKEPDEYAKRLPLSNLKMIDPRNPTLDNYMNIFRKSFKNFSPSDKKNIENYASFLEDLNIEVKLVATKQSHSLDITQTRKDVIVVAGGRIGYSTFVHEVYHIISRKYPGITPTLASWFGFQQIKPVEVEDEFHILNPDSVLNEYEISLVDPDSGDRINAVPYMIMGLRPKLQDKNGKSLDEKWIQIYKQYIPHTSYVAQPEEICAEYFAKLFAGSCLFPSSNKNNSQFFEYFEREIEVQLRKYGVIK